MNVSKPEPHAPDPLAYAVAAQFVAAHVAQLSGLYVSVDRYGITVQGDPTLTTQQQIDALRRLARYLTVSVRVDLADGRFPVRSYNFDADYDGVLVHGFVLERVEVGRTDEVKTGATVTVISGGAA